MSDDVVVFDAPQTITVIESADGHTRCTLYRDFCGTTHYTLAGREIQLNGFEGEMTATTVWRFIRQGSDPAWSPVANLVERMKMIVDGERHSVTRRYDAMLAKVEANDVPMVPPPNDGR